MPGSGPHRFYFADGPPIIVYGLAALFFANTLIGLVLAFGAEYLLPRASSTLPACEEFTRDGVQYHAPVAVCWHAAHWIEIQWILLGLIGLTFTIFHKRVRYLYMGPRRSKE